MAPVIEPVVEFYNRAVQCQATQRAPQRGRRRRHLSDQSVKTETPSTAANAVQLRLELGHRAMLRDRPTADGFTHDWVVYIRGADGANIQHFVDKVEFHLHESFPKSRRVVKEAPYQVSETGYGGFTLPIDVYLRNNGEPKKLRFQYDLFLGTAGVVSHERCEQLTFHDPSSLFRERLVAAGAVTAEHDDWSTASSGESTGSAASAAAARLHLTGGDSLRPASAPLPQLQHLHDRAFEGKEHEFRAQPAAAAAAAAAAVPVETCLESRAEIREGVDGRPLTYLQRRLHCRVALSAAQRPASAADDRRAMTDSAADDVVIVGSSWTKDARRTAALCQPKLEPGVNPAELRAGLHYQSAGVDDCATAREQYDWTTRRLHADVVAAVGSTSSLSARHVVPPAARDSSAPPVHVASNAAVTQPPVKRRRGRPRKSATNKTNTTKSRAAVVPTNVDNAGDFTKNRFIYDKENIVPAKTSDDKPVERSIWTSSAIRDLAPIRESPELKTLGDRSAARRSLAELSVNVVLSDGNNFNKKPPDGGSGGGGDNGGSPAPEFPASWIRDVGKDKLMSVWNAIKDTLKENRNPAQRRDEDVARPSVPQRGPAAQRSDGVDDLPRRPTAEPGTASADALAVKESRQSAVKAVHWKTPDVDDVKFEDEPVAGKPSARRIVDDFDVSLPLFESVGQPLFTSTPVKKPTPVPAADAAVSAPAKRARVRYRPVARRVADDDDDVCDRVELSRLAALPSLRHGVASAGTQVSGVRPADVVRAFRTIDEAAAVQKAAAAAAVVSPATVIPAQTAPLPFIVGVPAPTSAQHTEIRAPPCAQPVGELGRVQPTAAAVSANSLASETLPASSVAVTAANGVHFYGARYDSPPYNRIATTGGFVTKAARKRPITDDDAPAAAAPSAKRFQADAASARAPPLATGASAHRPEVTSSAMATSGVRRAANGVSVDALLRLQRQLSSVSDAATLRRVVQIIGETGRYCVNEVTFDFDLCNLDPTTVSQLIHCLDSATGVAETALQ